MNVNLPPITFQGPVPQSSGTLAAGEKGDGGGDGTGYEPEAEEDEPDEEEDDEEANLWRYQKFATPSPRLRDDLDFSDEAQEVLGPQSEENPVSFAQWAPRQGEVLARAVDIPMEEPWQFTRPRRRTGPCPPPRVEPEPSETREPRPRGLRFENDGFHLEPHALFQVIQDGYIQELEFLPELESLERDPCFVPSERPRPIEPEEVAILRRRPPPPLRSRPPAPVPETPAPPKETAPPPPPQSAPMFQIAPRSRRPNRRGGGVYGSRPAPPAVIPDQEPPPPPRQRLAPEIPHSPRFSTGRPRSAGPHPPAPAPRDYQSALPVETVPKSTPCEREGHDEFPQCDFSALAGLQHQVLSSSPAPVELSASRRREFTRRSGARAGGAPPAGHRSPARTGNG